MGKIKSFEIKLDDIGCVFAPGAIISGTVTVELVKQKKVSGVLLYLHGECRVRFTRGQQKRNDRLSNGEQYFSQRIDLLSKGSRDTFVITPGKHVYPFSVQLPNTLPTSFEGQYGHVRYWARAQIVSEGLISAKSQSTVLPFTVIQPLDLNADAEAKQSYQGEASKQLGPMCCPLGTVSFLAQLDHIGYVPGLDIPIGVEVQNRTSRKVLWLKYTLKQINTYTLHKPELSRESQTRTENIVLAEARCKGVKPKRTEIIHRGITIPPVPPSNLHSCRHISVKYSLEILAKIDHGCFSAPEYVELPATPVVVGTIPLLGTVPSPQIPLAPTEASAPPLEDTLPRDIGAVAACSTIPAEPPPSYMESVLGAHQISVTFDGDTPLQPSAPPPQAEPIEQKVAGGSSLYPDPNAPEATPNSGPVVTVTPPDGAAGGDVTLDTLDNATVPVTAPGDPNNTQTTVVADVSASADMEENEGQSCQVLFAPKYSFYRRTNPACEGSVNGSGEIPNPSDFKTL